MCEIRVAINKMLRTEKGATILRDYQWAPIQAAIDVAMPPGEEEICVALRELGKVLGLAGDCPWITQYMGDRYSIFTYKEGDQHRLGGCNSRDELAAAIYSCIPKPEPTVEEEWETVRQALIRRGLVETNLGRALARLRKQLEEK